MSIRKLYKTGHSIVLTLSAADLYHLGADQSPYVDVRPSRSKMLSIRSVKISTRKPERA